MTIIKLLSEKGKVQTVPGLKLGSDLWAINEENNSSLTIKDGAETRCDEHLKCTRNLLFFQKG